MSTTTEDEAADQHGTTTVYRCVCGMTTESMDGFVQHVSDDHDAFDIAVQSLLDDELEVSIDE